ncbi:MAG: serine/threonine-protein kinase, partial [Propionibacteriaceae bacterium]|nr:serine/threonine-protein kinase [Propionibacteriaceae bacterium]
MSPDVLAGRYELTEKIASGGMGQVWRGRDRVLERIVAIKTVDLAAQESTARERFRREAIATAGLSAPNIVQVYDGGVDDTTAYLVMELLTGPTLARVIHDHGPMGIEEGIKVSLEVARALLTAHRVGIVHRDIKPGNVMYHHDQVKLVDFGIAQFARSLGAALTAPATALGTAAYMSPEQATGEGATDKSDWYALGCLMTTMFTGNPPFTGEALAVANQQINAKPPYLSDRRSDVPLALDRLVAGLLAKEPADRPTGDEVVEELRQLSVRRGDDADPNASTILLAGAAGAAGVPDPTAVYAESNVSPWARPDERRASYRESPAEPAPSAPPVRPVPPPPVVRDQRTARDRNGTPIGLVVTVILLLLAVGVAGAYLLLGNRPNPAPVAPTPTVTAQPTSTPTQSVRPTTTRPTVTSVRPTPTMRQPTPTMTTTEPEPTSAPPTSEPTTTSPSTTEPTSDGNQGASGEAGVQNAISGVNRAYRPALRAGWAEAKRLGDPQLFETLADRLQAQGVLSKKENKALIKAVNA